MVMVVVNETVIQRCWCLETSVILATGMRARHYELLAARTAVRSLQRSHAGLRSRFPVKVI